MKDYKLKRNFRIVLPGQAPIKKNSMGEMWFRTDKKTNAKIPLKAPIKYYSKAYTSWAKKNVIVLGNWKQQHEEEFSLPLSGAYIITFLFFRRTNERIDLSNLYEGVQDLLTGHAGNFLDKTTTKGGVKRKIKFNHDLYKIFDDDNSDIRQLISSIFLGIG